MSYYDPQIYNYSNLDENDKKFIDNLMHITLSTIGRKFCDYSYDLEYADNCLDRIRLEERKEATKEMVDAFLDDVVSIMVAMIDSSDSEIKEVETNTYFHGFKFPDFFYEMEEDYDECDYCNCDECQHNEC